MIIREEIPDEALYADFRREAGWDVPSPERCRKALSRTLCALVAYDGDTPVAMARLVGDGAVVIYLQDVVVRQSHRERGVGTRLVAAIIALAQRQYPEEATFGLLAAAGQDGLYAKFGFVARPQGHLGPGMLARLGDLVTDPSSRKSR